MKNQIVYILPGIFLLINAWYDIRKRKILLHSIWIFTVLWILFLMFVDKEKIWQAFGGAAKNLVVNSTKSMIGHLLGAAGGVEFVTCVKSLEEGFIHQTVGTTEPDEECDLNYAIGAPVEKEIRYAMSNSLGFGGHNATLLVKKYEG